MPELFKPDLLILFPTNVDVFLNSMILGLFILGCICKFVLDNTFYMELLTINLIILFISLVWSLSIRPIYKQKENKSLPSERLKNSILYNIKTSLEKAYMPEYESKKEPMIDELCRYSLDDLKIAKHRIGKQIKLYEKNSQYAKQILPFMIGLSAVLLIGTSVPMLIYVNSLGIFWIMYQAYSEKTSILTKQEICIELIEEAEIKKSANR